VNRRPSRTRRSTIRRSVAGTALGAAVLLAAALCSLAGRATPARANGVPTDVQLSYINLSNWGPKDATGTAELIFSEGIVRLTANGLTQLTNQQYQGWLVDSQSGDAISFGRFNADATGAVSYQGSLPPIANFGFDLVILTVEQQPDDAPQPSTQRSIGGYFSLVGQTVADAQATSQTGAAGSARGAGTAPGALPNTGDPTWMSDIERVGLLLGIMGLSVFVGLRLGRRSA
jgi:Anti-sigma-K factor rskA, C-terminal